MKKILKSILAIVLLVPCAFLFTACGKMKSLEGKTFSYSKLEVTGSLNKEDYESLYRGISFTFDKTTVVHSDAGADDTYDYKFENGKVFIASEDEDFSSDPYAVISGNYMVLTQNYSNGSVKVYFKLK